MGTRHKIAGFTVGAFAVTWVGGYWPEHHPMIAEPDPPAESQQGPPIEITHAVAGMTVGSFHGIAMRQSSIFDRKR